MSFTRSLAAGAAFLAAATLVLPAAAETLGAIHIFPTPAWREKTGRIPHINAATTMEYFGGPVFSEVKVVSVMWGKRVLSNTEKKIPTFSAALVDSTFVDQLKEYSTIHHSGVTGHRGTKQTISRGAYLGQTTIIPSNKSISLTDADIQAELQHQIQIGALPPQDPNMLYMVYFPATVTITAYGARSCTDFGAYHSAAPGKPKASNIFYSVEPECGLGFSYITNAGSHEFAEAMTDNIPTPGSNPDYPQAWNTSDGYEIGDLCESYSATLTSGATHWKVQQVFLNSTNACSTGNYASP
jgi:hypothetical protein